MSWQRRVLVVEDEPLVASLLSEALATAGFRTATAGNSADARELAEEFDPDAALIDIHLGPGPNGVQLGHVLHQLMPQVALVFLTKYFDPRAVEGSPQCMPPGSSFLAKDRVADVGALIDCIEATLRPGGLPPRDDLRVGRALSVLTDAQIEVLRLAAAGLTNSAIARLRGTSERATERRLQEVYDALCIAVSPHVNQRVEAVKRFIVEAGLPQAPVIPGDE